jgi:hypothetical protein
MLVYAIGKRKGSIRDYGFYARYNVNTIEEAIERVQHSLTPHLLIQFDEVIFSVLSDERIVARWKETRLKTGVFT